MRFSCGCPPVGASDPIAIVGAAELKIFTAAGEPDGLE